ncbi:hypothetical protein GY45DRAFT_465562 [Cubamyces sp. BRFM 1775]|nr:hypothetical protein GY45DRAFT_465562 [Cubamyces sp. BRFM 1775]
MSREQRERRLDICRCICLTAAAAVPWFSNTHVRPRVLLHLHRCICAVSSTALQHMRHTHAHHPELNSKIQYRHEVPERALHAHTHLPGTGLAAHNSRPALAAPIDHVMLIAGRMIVHTCLPRRPSWRRASSTSRRIEDSQPVAAG